LNRLLELDCALIATGRQICVGDRQTSLKVHHVSEALVD